MLLFYLNFQLVKNGSRTPSQCESPVPDFAEADEEPPRMKCFKHLEKVLEKRLKEGLEKTAQLPPGKAELERYLGNVVTVSERVDPVTFWVGNEASYPLLSSLAIDLSCIPASSAPVVWQAVWFKNTFNKYLTILQYYPYVIAIIII